MRVRQALRYLVDYDGMANSFLKGAAQVHQTFWASGFWAALDENPYKLDPAKAKALLAEAGYPDGFAIDLDAPNFAPFVNMAQSVQSTMAQGGVKVNIVSAEMKPMLTKYRARQHQIADGLLGSGLHGPAHQRRRLRHQSRQLRRGTKGKPLAWRNSWQDEDGQRQ